MRVVPVVLVLAAACGGGGGDSPDGPPGADAAPHDPFASPMGSILIIEQDGRWDGSPGAASAVWVTMSDGPRYPFHRETGRTGECRLMEWQPSNTCPTPCDGVCTIDGCIAWPAYLDAGTIMLTGTHDPITIEREPVSGRYYSGVLPVELFDAGATITATAPGGADVPAFSLAAPAPAPIVTTFTNPVELAHDADAAFAWTADPAGGTSVLLTITSANYGHGAPYDAIIECASADDGEIVVPGSYVAALGTLSGVACLVGHECPPATLTRYRHASTTAGPGEIELWPATERVFYVRHDPN